MTCHYYYVCDKCRHEFSGIAENEEAKPSECPKCGCDKIKQGIACDFKNPLFTKPKGWKRLLFWKDFFTP